MLHGVWGESKAVPPLAGSRGGPSGGGEEPWPAGEALAFCHPKYDLAAPVAGVEALVGLADLV